MSHPPSFRSLDNNLFFQNNYIIPSDSKNINAPLIEAAFSLTGLAQKSLQTAHNKLALEIEDNNAQHVLLRKIIIGAGFLGTIFLGVIETIVRYVMEFFVQVIGVVMHNYCSDELSDLGRSMIIFSDASVEYTFYGIGQAAVSLWSHCSSSESEIDYQNQANLYLFSYSSESQSRKSLGKAKAQLQALEIIPL